MTSHTPDHILNVGMGFMASKTLLSAIELELFSLLAVKSMTATEIEQACSLNMRSSRDFLDALVALEFLNRDADGESAIYRNTPDTEMFLSKRSPAYLGGILEMANARLYPFWGNLTKALRTGLPQNEVAQGKGNPFDELYAHEDRLEQFLGAMQGFQMGNIAALLDKVDLTNRSSMCDVGGANGALAAMVAKRYKDISCKTFDLPPVAPVARRNLSALNVAERVEVVSGDFFIDDLPHAEVITMGNILHDWDESQKKALIRKAYNALPPDGMYIAIESIIDDARRKNAAGLLMSLNMLIEMPGGFDYSGAQFSAWCLEAGFKRTEVVPLAGPCSAAIAYK